MADCWVERLAQRGGRRVFVWGELRVEGSELELARECVVGQRFVSSPPVSRKKQIPRSARNDNLRAFQRVVRRVVGQR